VVADLATTRPHVLMLNLSGFLRYVPYAALKSEHGYFVEDYALVLATPAAETQAGAADTRPPTAAGFGVSTAHEGFAALPGVTRELEMIFSGSDGIGTLQGEPHLDTSFDVSSL